MAKEHKKRWEELFIKHWKSLSKEIREKVTDSGSIWNIPLHDQFILKAKLLRLEYPPKGEKKDGNK